MSDPSGMPGFQDLYQQVLQQYPRSTGKKASPQKDMQAAVSWKKMIDSQLGFDPSNYESPMPKQYSPKSSAVLEQYKGTPLVSHALDDIKNGVENSSSLASLLIDPATGEVTQDGTKLGYDTASATTSVKAAQEYEKEAAQNTTAQQDYEARQLADPTFGRTQGSTGGKHVLPEGDLNGMEKPSFQYSQGIADLVAGLSNANGKVSLPMAPPTFGHPGGVVGQIATAPNPYGGMAVDTSIHGRTSPLAVASPQENIMGSTSSGGQPPMGAGDGRQSTPIMAHATGSFAHPNVLADLVQRARQLTPRVGQSDQQRAVSGVSAMQDYAQKYAQPVRSQANNAAVQRLLSVMALQG